MKVGTPVSMNSIGGVIDILLDYPMVNQDMEFTPQSVDHSPGQKKHGFSASVYPRYPHSYHQFITMNHSSPFITSHHHSSRFITNNNQANSSPLTSRDHQSHPGLQPADTMLHPERYSWGTPATWRFFVTPLPETTYQDSLVC